MPNVKGLFADPEFKSLDPAAQKSILAGIDPEFGSLSDIDFAAVKQHFSGSQFPPTPNTITASHGPQSWLQDLAGDIRHGTTATLPGRALRALGAKGTEYGNSPGVSDYMAGPLLGPIRAAQGVTELPSQPWQGTKDIAGGAWQAAQIPGAFMGPEMLPNMEVPQVARRAGAVAKGAAQGAYKGATEMVPATHGILRAVTGNEFNLPAVIAHGGQGAAVGRALGGQTGEAIGGAAGAVYPVVRGAYQGGKTANRVFNLMQEAAARSELPAGGSMGQGMQSGFGVPPVSKYVPDPEDMWTGTSPSPIRGPGPLPPEPIPLKRADFLPGWQQAGVRDTAASSPGPAQVGKSPNFKPVRTPIPPVPPERFGPTAPSTAGNAGFVPGQYDLTPPPEARYTPDPEDIWNGATTGPPNPAGLPPVQEPVVPWKIPISKGKVGKTAAAAPAAAPTAAPAPLAPSVEQNLPGGHAVSLTMPPDAPEHYAAYGADRGAAQLATALAKDRSLIQHFESQGVTPETFKAADQQQRNRWLAEANKGLGKRYKPYQGDAGESSAQRLLQTWGSRPSL